MEVGSNPTGGTFFIEGGGEILPSSFVCHFPKESVRACENDPADHHSNESWNPVISVISATVRIPTFVGIVMVLRPTTKHENKLALYRTSVTAPQVTALSLGFKAYPSPTGR